MKTKKYKVWERIAVEREIHYCEECHFHTGAYFSGSGWGGNVCMYHQRQIENAGKEHVPIPDWCKIDKCEYTLSGRNS